MTFQRIPAISLSLSLLILAGCSQSDHEIRSYQEVTTQVALPAGKDSLPPNHPMSSMPPAMGTGQAGSDMAALADQVTASSLALSWTTPDGWIEKPGTGVRLVTFVVDNTECTITAFPGSVGGNEANIRRWLGQLQVSLPDDAIAGFAAKGTPVTTQGGFNGIVYDFADILPEGSPQSMLAAVIETEGQSAFVKWTGPRALLASGKQAFFDLCQSLTMKDGGS